MGRRTHNFRQSKSSMSGARGVQAYSQQQRSQPWHKRAWENIKNRGQFFLLRNKD